MKPSLKTRTLALRILLMKAEMRVMGIAEQRNDLVLRKSIDQGMEELNQIQLFLDFTTHETDIEAASALRFNQILDNIEAKVEALNVINSEPLRGEK